MVADKDKSADEEIAPDSDVVSPRITNSNLDPSHGEGLTLGTPKGVLALDVGATGVGSAYSEDVGMNRFRVSFEDFIDHEVAEERIETITKNLVQIDQDAPLEVRVDAMLKGVNVRSQNRAKPERRPSPEDALNFIEQKRNYIESTKRRRIAVVGHLLFVKQRLDERQDLVYRASDHEKAIEGYTERASRRVENTEADLQQYFDEEQEGEEWPIRIDDSNYWDAFHEFMEGDDDWNDQFNMWSKADREWEWLRLHTSTVEFQYALMIYQAAFLDADVKYYNELIREAEAATGFSVGSGTLLTPRGPLINSKITAHYSTIRQIRIKQAGFQFLRTITGWTYNRMATNCSVAQSAITRFMNQDVSRIKTPYFDKDSKLVIEDSYIDFKEITLQRVVDTMMETMRREAPPAVNKFIHDTGWVNVCAKKIFHQDTDALDDYMPRGAQIFPWEPPKGPKGLERPKHHHNYILHCLKLSAAAIAIVSPLSETGTDAAESLQLQEVTNELRQSTPLVPASKLEPLASSDTGGLFPIIGYVQAGDWQTAFEEPEPELVSYPGVSADEAQFGLRVCGDSMDKQFPEGSILYCASYNDAEDELPLGKYVIVMREDKSSDQVEATCKRFEKHESLPDVYVGVPESSNPQHDDIILEETSTKKVWIHAVVKGAYIKY